MVAGGLSLPPGELCGLRNDHAWPWWRTWAGRFWHFHISVRKGNRDFSSQPQPAIEPVAQAQRRPQCHNPMHRWKNVRALRKRICGIKKHSPEQTRNSFHFCKESRWPVLMRACFVNHSRVRFASRRRGRGAHAVTWAPATVREVTRC